MKRPSTTTAAPLALPAADRFAGKAAAAFEALRYLLVSAAALAVDFGGLMLLATVFGCPYPVAAAVGFSAGLVVAYVGSTRWAFRTRACRNHQTEFAIFATIGIAGLLINELVLVLCVTGLALPLAVAKIASAGLVFAFNFGLRKAVLFTPASR